MTTAICFDLDGTLVRFTEPYESILDSTFEEHLGKSSTALLDTYDRAFFVAFKCFEPDPYRRGMEAVLKSDEVDADLDGVDPEAMVATLRKQEYAATELPKPARGAIEQLSERAKLGIITNGTPEWQAGKLAHHGISDLFDAVITSYEAGAHKPDPAPFELARERLPADKYAMVGDDYEADVEGSRAAGFVPIHFEESEDDGPGFWKTLSVML